MDLPKIANILHFCLLMASVTCLRQVEYKEYAKGVVVSPSSTLTVSYLWQCAVICRKLLVCSAFSMKANFANTGSFNCSIALGDFSWVQDSQASLFMEDIGPTAWNNLLTDGRFYRLTNATRPYQIHNAKNTCVTQNSTLSVTYPKKRRDTIRAFTTTNQFIGINFNMSGAGDWMTDEGVTFKTNRSDPNQPWGTAQPDDTGERCLHEFNLAWFDAPCDGQNLTTPILCRKDNVYERSPVNGKYYKLHYTKATPAGAADMCASEGGTLAIAYGATNWAAIAGYRARFDIFNGIPGFNKWLYVFHIAGSDQEVEGTWKMPDGSSFDVSNRANDPDQRWAPAEPNGPNNLVYVPSGGFADVVDNYTARFLCEIVV